MTHRIPLCRFRPIRAGLLSLLAATVALPAPGHAADTTVTSPPFLTQIDGKKALDWVRRHNRKTLDALTADPRFKTFEAEALDIGQSPDRIPFPALHGDRVYNFWRDKTHKRGLLRVTTRASYPSDAPDWSPVLDIDALAAAEKENWFFHGLICLEPAETRCLVALSKGGEDAVTLREFDLTTRQFVPDGFTLPRAKQHVSWLDADTLLISRPWTPGDVTTSSYPYVIKSLHRGQKLADAHTVFSGSKKDMTDSAVVPHDSRGDTVALIDQMPTFFTHRYFLLENGVPHAFPLPAKADLEGLIDGRIILQINAPWRGFPAGSVLAVRPNAADPAPEAIIKPTARQTIDEVSISQNRLMVALYDNVQGQGWIYQRDPDGWQGKRLPLPGNSSVSLGSSTLTSPVAFISTSGFLTPTTLYQVDTAAGAMQRVKQAPAHFDSHGLTVEQHQARSRDGTMIPYFEVHRADMPKDGRNPTLLYAYGGFQVSETPYYSGVLGKLWLARGGTYVLANIRGGGEFGPAWHDAGLKTHRQRVFDDFAAVGQDLIARKVTSPAHLAIKGGSNGGLLMGVEFTQHPDLWKATIIQVPLLDMLHFESLSAGASWVGEYGSNSVPAEHAFLKKISPVQALKAGVAYPVPLITTTTRDDRVGPVHARRFAARMEDLHLPFFYYEQIEGGHSSGANIPEQAKEAALEYTYLWRALGDARP